MTNESESVTVRELWESVPGIGSSKCEGPEADCRIREQQKADMATAEGVGGAGGMSEQVRSGLVGKGLRFTV